VYAEGIVKCGGGRVWVSLGGVGSIQFYEGVKDFVGKDGMVIVDLDRLSTIVLIYTTGMTLLKISLQCLSHIG
jgi:hypothetical protein